ncbi:MAG: hypothetical protein SVR94_15095, partial [Pseudomonadota bacterium]|nr:hypothetical protein [Pseudomonadota bacterium]
MRENKVLAVAIASALSIGTGAVQAGTLYLLDPRGGEAGSGSVASPPVYATEFFPASGTTEVIPQALPGKGASGYSGPNGTPRYHVQYDFDNDAIGDELETPFEIQFSLNNGATWGAEVNAALMSGGGDVRLISEETLAPYASSPEISKAAGGNPTDSTVTFLVQANETDNLPKSAIFEFVFDMDDLNSLNTRGNTIDLTVEPRANVGTSVIAVDTIQSIPIAQSEEGVQVAILPDTTPG